MPKSKKTAIYFYCQEMMRRQHRQISMKEAIEEFYTSFKSLSSDEKAVYERMCAEYRDQERFKSEPEVKIKIDPILAHPEYDVDRAAVGLKDLRDLFGLNGAKSKHQARDQAAASAVEEQIKDQKWYFIKFITFCRCDSSDFKDRPNYSPYYVLGEVSLIEYSLREGVSKVYNEFILPNQIPLGYRAACMDSSNNSHKIPLSNFDHVRKGYETIYMDILNFVGNDPNVMLFSLEADNEETVFGLHYLYDQAMSKAKNVFPLTKVYDLECLLMFLAEFKEIELVYTGANEILTSSMYDYCPKSLCDYHEDLVLKECAQGYIKRSAYAISDNLCSAHYNIELTTKHIPASKPVGTIIESVDFKSVISRSSRNRYSSSAQSISSLNSDKRSGGPEASSRPIQNRDMNTGFGAYANDAGFRPKDPEPHLPSKYRYPAQDVRVQHQQQAPQARPYPQTSRRLVSDKLESLSNRSQADSDSVRNTRSMVTSETLTTISGYDHMDETASVGTYSKMTEDGRSTISTHMPSLMETEQFDDDQSSMTSGCRSQTAAPKKFIPANQDIETQLPGNEDDGWREVKVPMRPANQSSRLLNDDENSSIASSGVAPSRSSGRSAMGRGKLFKLNQ